MTEIPKPEKGTWFLISPRGNFWQGKSPLNVIKQEMDERVPKEIQIKRVLKAIFPDMEED